MLAGHIYNGEEGFTRAQLKEVARTPTWWHVSNYLYDESNDNEDTLGSELIPNAVLLIRAALVLACPALRPQVRLPAPAHATQPTVPPATPPTATPSTVGAHPERLTPRHLPFTALR